MYTVSTFLLGFSYFWPCLFLYAFCLVGVCVECSCACLGVFKRMIVSLDGDCVHVSAFAVSTDVIAKL